MQAGVTIFVLLFVILVIFAIFRSIQTKADYSQARQDYLSNPNDAENKLRLIEAASAKSANMHSGGLDAIALMEATRTPVVVNTTAPRDLTSELQRLAELHAGGHLTDHEFERAKAKLLS